MTLWKEGDEQKIMEYVEQITDINLWKVTKVDLVQWYEVFNILDEMLERLVKLRTEESSEEEKEF